ncbi:MAG: hypothetical protein ACRDI3_04660 [Actinomycetota bacterium]
MDPSDILLALLTAAVTASWGQTQWRLVRLERRMDDFHVELAKKPDRAELDALRAELANKPDREELSAIRADLTQIALAVGATRPKASGS